MDVDKVLAEAVHGEEGQRRLTALKKMAHELEVMASAFAGAVDDLRRDAGVPLDAFPDSAEETLAYRALHGAQCDVLIAKTTLYDFMRRVRG